MYKKKSHLSRMKHILTKLSATVRWGFGKKILLHLRVTGLIIFISFLEKFFSLIFHWLLFFSDKYPQLTKSPTLSDPIVKQHTFEFNCHIDYDPSKTDVGFPVSWLFDNKTDPIAPVTTINGTARDVTLDQKYLKFNLGKTVR